MTSSLRGICYVYGECDAMKSNLRIDGTRQEGGLFYKELHSLLSLFHGKFVILFPGKDK